MNTAELSKRWRELSRSYVDGVNDFVARDIATKGESGTQPPEENRAELAGDVLNAVRDANRAEETANLRELFPPATEPFHEYTREGSPIEPILLPDGGIVARVGAPYDENALGVVVIRGAGYERLPTVRAVGRCPNRRYFALAGGDAVTVTDGWGGETVMKLAYPAVSETPLPVTTLAPFPDGKRVLLVSSVGIWVLSDTGAVRLLPEDDDGDAMELSMEHGAMSPDGKWIAAGNQDGKHYLFDAETYTLAAQIGPHGEYPHYALFSTDSQHVALNACHFYAGGTICVATKDVLGMNTDFYEEDSRIRLIEDGARVYAGVARPGEFLLGDAYGYVRGCGITDGLRWRHYIGGTVSGMDISEDGKRLLVGTYAGILADIALDAATTPDPFTIGYGGNHLETRRYLFWDKPTGEMLVW
ncbi:MAG: WD40 repeat domain-containing protein [Armatimonadetes bacterium]|nr:WD40 repeat domain-containing protein [Armatimonadota bacterium]